MAGRIPVGDINPTADPASPPAIGIVESGDVTRTQIRGSTLLLAGQGIALIANLVTQVLLVRYLSKTEYGAFAYGLSIVALGETFAALGLRRGVSRFMPIYEERHELDKAAGLFVFALATVISLGLAVMLIVIGLRGIFAGSLAGGTETATLLAILIALVPLHAVEYLLDSVFAVFARPRAIAARKYVFAPIMRLVVVALLVLSSSGVEFVAAGYVGAGVLGIAIYSTLLAGTLRDHGLLAPIRERRMAFPLREVLKFTLPMLTHDVSAVLLTTAGTVLLGVMRDASAVAELRAVMPVALTLSYILSNFGVLFMPLAARLLARGDGAEMNRLYWQTAAWTTLFSFPIFLMAFLFASPVTVLLFGNGYAHADVVLAALIVGFFVSAATGPNGALLGVYGEVRFVVWTNVAAVVVNITLSVLLIALAGALGAAIATSAAIVLLSITWQVGIARRTAVHGIDREYARFYLLMVVITAGLACVQVLASPPLGIAAVLVTTIWIALLLVARRELAFAETFEELARLPFLRRLLRPREVRP